MLEFKADLHCHTTCSDGTLTPTEIVLLAKEKGLSGLSITDHDSIEAYKTAPEVAINCGLQLIPGTEFSAMHKGNSVHLLGYSFPLSSPLIDEFCLKHKTRRENRNREILAKLAEKGMLIEEEEIENQDITMKHTIGRPHIAIAMLKKGYVSSLQEAFNHYIGDGMPCYASGGYFTVEETIDLIHAAKGLAILAHPHIINNQSLLKELLEMNFDGIECYYSRYTKDKCDRWLHIAKKKGWIITGGSDFHGAIKPTLPLGSSWVGQESFNILYNHYKSQ